MMQFELITTDDGSHTLYVSELNEVYHSKFGAVNESKHVFIMAGLMPVCKEKKSISILEIGFGTALNALMTFFETPARIMEIDYHTIEPNPLNSEILKQLNYPEFVKMKGATQIFNVLHESEWGTPVRIDDRFTLIKYKIKLEDARLSQGFYDLVYFDAFGPEVQPELWTVPIFEKIHSALKDKGILVTYSAKGSVRRNLESAGFSVERIPGPAGKREMIRAIKHETEKI